MDDGPVLLHDVVVRAAAAAPGALAVVDEAGASLTFGELAADVDAVAAWVASCTAPGDRVAVVADNGLAYVSLYYGVPRAGRVLLLVNQRLAPPEQVASIAAGGASLVVGDRQHLAALGPLLEDRPGGSPFLVDLATAPWSRPAWRAPTAPPLPASPPQPDDPAWMLFTSGSTGEPKGVVHTHRSLLAGVRGTIDGRGLGPGETYLLPFPMCHIAGYNVVVHHALGGAVVLVARYRPDSFVALAERHGVTSCSLAPTMLHALLAHLDETGGQLPTLRAVHYGSSGIAPELLRRAAARLDVGFNQGYGMTEAAGNVTFLGADEHRRGVADEPELLLAAGRPHAAVELRILDDDGRSLPPGAVGEIALRGEQLLLGYWRAGTVEPATADGWFRTGDIGRVDGDGLLHVVDRRKDVIVTGGENVASREVEDALAEHPDVDQVAVVGVPDEYWGEAICAVVVPATGRRPDADELVAHVRARLAPFKRPRHVLFVDALPLLASGKVAKPAVRKLAADAVTP